MSKAKSKGFSLIELLIVVAVILVLAAISIKYLRQAHVSANESSAVASVRSTITAQQMYVSHYPDTGYADTLTKLGPAVVPSEAAAALIDATLASGEKAGYKFELTGGGDEYFILAKPVWQNRTGIRTFCSNSRGVIRAEVGKCDMNSPIIPK